ncbi:MAG: MBL fold metallo-hydrolase [Flavitalea sp.]
MCVSITSLNSGSNGNCYYVGNNDEAVLIDAGISCRETEKRMSLLGLSVTKVKAIFISHEHTDHVSGLQVLAHKYQLPVYITKQTLRGCRFKIDSHLIHTFKAFENVEIGGLTICAFPKKHDAKDPHSFIVSSSTVRVGVFTDIGECCTNLEYHFRQCHAAFLESNYDTDMLMNGKYPYYLKRRISGGQGHLSNNQAKSLFMEHRPSFMTHLLLAHLSKENNCPDLVRQLFNQHAHHTQIIIASRFEQTPLYQIIPVSVPNFSLPVSFSVPIPKAKQLSLF